MSSGAFSGVGTVFKRSATSTGALAAIAEVNSISGPNKSKETIDVTSLDSPDGYREFIGSFRDPGEVVLSMNFTRAGYDALNADFEADAPNDKNPYQIVFSDTDNTTLDFIALVTGATINTPSDDKVMMEITLKISGTVVLST